MQELLAYRDGAYLPKDQIRIELDDLGFERGFAVFDYCRERNGRVTFLQDHMERLAHSQSILNLPREISTEDVKQILLHLQAENNLGDSYFKMIISARMTNQVVEPLLTIYQDHYVPYVNDMFEEGIALILSEFSKPFPEYKTTFYLGSLREFTRMKESGAEDVLFYADNIIRECARCNIFMIKGNAVYTPDKNMLKGVTRKHVINCAKEKYFVIEKDITIEELFQADEIFITSTTKNIMPVVRIEDRLIGAGKPGMITNDLMKLFESYCQNYATD